MYFSHHHSFNEGLVLQLLDYSDNINTDALIVIPDFHKASDTVEHYFLFKALYTFVLLKCFIKLLIK